MGCLHEKIEKFPNSKRKIQCVILHAYVYTKRWLRNAHPESYDFKWIFMIVKRFDKLSYLFFWKKIHYVQFNP